LREDACVVRLEVDDARREREDVGGGGWTVFWIRMRRRDDGTPFISAQIFIFKHSNAARRFILF